MFRSVYMSVYLKDNQGIGSRAEGGGGCYVEKQSGLVWVQCDTKMVKFKFLKGKSFYFIQPVSTISMLSIW